MSSGDFRALTPFPSGIFISSLTRWQFVLSKTPPVENIVWSVLIRKVFKGFASSSNRTISSYSAEMLEYHYNEQIESSIFFLNKTIRSSEKFPKIIIPSWNWFLSSLTFYPRTSYRVRIKTPKRLAREVIKKNNSWLTEVEDTQSATQNKLKIHAKAAIFYPTDTKLAFPPHPCFNYKNRLNFIKFKF